MQVVSKLRYARISPQKCRLVADVVRGKAAGNALATLQYMPKKGAELVRKVLAAAVANAEHNHGADIDELKVSLIHIDAAPVLKRFAARSIWMRLTDASASFFFRNSRTRKSVCTCAGNCCRPANQRELQSRVMPSRMPSGLTF